MMTRIILRLVFPPVLLFALVMGAIRAQPHTDSIIMDYAQPTDCAPPCFMGLRPGVTTRAEAYNILWRHQWVRNVFEHNDHMHWTWSGQQPDYIDGAVRGRANLTFGAMMGGDTQTIQQIRVQTTIPTGDGLLTLGEPQGMASDYGRGGIWVIALYGDIDFALMTMLDGCSATRTDWLRAPLAMHFDDYFVYREQVGVDPIRQICNR